MRIVKAGGGNFVAFYESAGRAVQNLDPYLSYTGHGARPNLNPPLVVWAMQPLAHLPLPAALLLWWTLNLAAYVVLTWIIAKEVNLRWLVVSGVPLLFEPIVANLDYGQLAWIVALLTTLAWRADRRDRLSAGLWAGLAMYIKPFLLVLGAYWLWRRAWRPFALAMATMGGCTLLGLLFLGPHASLSWLGALDAITWQGFEQNASLYGLLTRAFRPTIPLPTALAQAPLQPPLIDAAAVIRPAWIIGSAVSVLLVARALARRDDRNTHWALVVLLAIWASPLGWNYYLALALAPIIASRVWTHPGAWLAGIGFVVPYQLITWPLTPLAAITIGSASTWSLLLLLLTVSTSVPTL